MRRLRLTMSFVALASSLAMTRVSSGQQQARKPAPHRSELSGFYRARQVNAAPTCSPRALPAPINRADSASYAIPALGSFPMWAHVTLIDSSVTIIPSDSLQRDAAPPIKGNRQRDGSYSTHRNLVFGPEPGPREGGRRLVVEVETRGHPRFERSGTETRWQANGVFTYRYHIDSATGPIYTICRHSYTVSGIRIAP